MPDLPVVFVPGFGGSFNLPVLLDWRGPTLSGWDFPPFVDYGQTFLRTFTRAGYTRDRDLFVAFYDWRKAVNDNANNYLVPWIDRARRRSGRNTVVLVAHSMGGLVARSYLQSRGYRNDVTHLITLGTPHRGSPEAFFTWEGGDIRWDGVAKAVLNVYLWYLERAHPFVTGLDRLRTIRTQAPGIRDLLPVDDYLINPGPPARFKAEDQMLERNLWGDVINAPSSLATLFGRVPVTTITGTGFTTLQSIIVQGPPPPVDDPPRYVDGTPDTEQTDGQGDGTVPLASAQLADPQVRNLASVAVLHGELPDKTAGLVLTELNTLPPSFQPPPPTPRLVVLTASPVEIEVEMAAGAPTILAETVSIRPASPRPRRRQPRRMRQYDFGHPGKHLHLVVIPEPMLGSYQVRLQGTGTGSFALGATTVGLESIAVSEASLHATDAAHQPLITGISTIKGHVAAETRLYYQVECPTYAAQPQIRFDPEATQQDLLIRLHTVVQETADIEGVRIQDLMANPQFRTQFAAAEIPEELRTTVETSLIEGDEAAVREAASLLAHATRPALALRPLVTLVEEVVGPLYKTLALGLLEQLRQIDAQSGAAAPSDTSLHG